MNTAAAVEQRHPLSSLIERIVAEREQSGLLTYWLLDRSALPQGRWIKDWLAGDAAVDLLTGERSIEPDGVTPILVDARSLRGSSVRTHRNVDELVRVAAMSNTVSLLRSTLALEALQVALQARTRVVLPQGLHAVLRYFDTRALPLLPRLLTPAQYAWMMQPVSHWYYLGRWGEVSQMPDPDSALLGTVPQVPIPLELDTAQEEMLLADGMTDAIIDMLLTMRHEALLHASPPQQFERIDPLVQQAGVIGFEDHADVFAFVGQALNRGDDFHVREPWAERFVRFRSGELSADQVFE